MSVESERLNVQTIFTSIDGEANAFHGAGQLATFIRLKGCNLRCMWCDTVYAQESEPENWMTVAEILGRVLSLDVSRRVSRYRKITITGGEPLLQQVALSELIHLLLDKAGLPNITIETNGSVIPLEVLNFPFVRLVMDYKLPSSGMEDRMCSLAFLRLRDTDVVKFVIADEVDYERAKQVIRENPKWAAWRVFSPVICDTNKDTHEVMHEVMYDWPQQLAEMMIKDEVPAQFSLQIHKVLWPGVKVER